MIANARMYSVSPVAGDLWRALLSRLFATADLPVTLIEHAAPAPMNELWERNDLGAVFMCGLPFARARPQPALLAAPVPAPADYAGEPRYWSELVVRADSRFESLADTYGSRIALTVPESQSGYAATLAYLMDLERGRAQRDAAPLFSEIVAPTITPLGSLSAVVHGEADVAPIDSYALALLQRFRPDLTSQVRSVARTPPTPIPAFVASDDSPPALQSAFLEAHKNATTKSLMDKLLLQRFVRPVPAAYDALRERHAAASAFWTSHPLAGSIHPLFDLCKNTA